MLEISVPNGPELRLEHLVLDVNGTLALDGGLLPGVAGRMRRLRNLVKVHLITADTHGRQAEIDEQLGLKAVVLRGPEPQGPEKAAYVERLGADGVVAIGNGTNDALMLRKAALAIVVLGPEGLSAAAAREADVLAGNIGDGLDLLLKPRRLIATLRG